MKNDMNEDIGAKLNRHKPMKYYLIGIAPFLLLLAGGMPFRHFVIEVVHANMILNGLILSVLVLGVLIIMQRIYSVQKEYATLDRFMETIEAGDSMADLLEESGIDETRVAHVLENIVATEGHISSQMVQTAMNEELEHVQHTFQASYDIPNYIVGFMIAMGLTGTFIGLLETMLGISSMLGGLNAGGGDMNAAVMGLISELQKPLAGMGTAFSASLFGLIGSSILGMMMLSLKYAVSDFMGAFRRYIALIVEHDEGTRAEGMSGAGMGAMMARSGITETFMKELTAQMVEQQTLSQDLFRQSQENIINAVVRIDQMSDGIHAVAELLKTHVETSKRMYDLLGYGPRMKDLSEQTLAEIKALNANQGGQAEGMEKVATAMGALDQRFVRVSSQLGEIATLLTKGAGGDGIKAIAAVVTAVQGQIAEIAKESGQGRQVGIDIARHLAEANNKLQDMRAGNESLSKIQEGSAKQAVLLDMMLTEIRSARNSIVRDLRAELRELSRNMAERAPGAE